jgi:hypothetical protein
MVTIERAIHSIGPTEWKRDRETWLALDEIVSVTYFYMKVAHDNVRIESAADDHVIIASSLANGDEEWRYLSCSQ